VNYGKDQKTMQSEASLTLRHTPAIHNVRAQELGSTSANMGHHAAGGYCQMAYAGELRVCDSGLEFRISDPSNPVDKGPGASFIGRHRYRWRRAVASCGDHL